MDRVFLDWFAPPIVILLVSLAPLALVFMLKMFKLKHRELDLEVELRGHLREAQLQALTDRIAANEHAVRSVVDALVAQRHTPAPPLEEAQEAPRTLGPARVR